MTGGLYSNGFVISAIAMIPRNIVARLKIFVNPVIEITTGLSMTRDNIPCFACLKYSSSFALAAGAAVSVSPIVSLKINCARTSFCLGVYREGACCCVVQRRLQGISFCCIYKKKKSWREKKKKKKNIVSIVIIFF